MRLFWLFLVLLILVLVPFLLWGNQFSAQFELQTTVDRLMELGRPWAWAGGIALLVSDLVLPVPGTIVMSALGYIYGPWLGGGLAVAGSMLSGILAYGVCWKIGRPAAEWIAGREDLAKGEAIFGGRAGGWLVALSRWLPILPEVIACLAGMVRMPCQRFVVALACGSLPLGFIFAAIGQWAHQYPGPALALSAGLPPLLWATVGPFLMRRQQKRTESCLQEDPCAGGRGEEGTGRDKGSP
ncbi:MAG: hypothetical protein CMO40_03825 [Verrucomicrobiaceae bacterium]|nr:hypothetical protein [Verrucomicrobiaceae bacterium]